MGTRAVLATTALLLIPLGISTKFYAGPFAWWVHYRAGDLIFAAFCVLAVLALFPRLRAGYVAAGVFLAASMLEFSQLWHPRELEDMRGSFVGHALLGSTFNWYDFLHYAVGCLAAAWLARRVQSGASEP